MNTRWLLPLALCSTVMLSGCLGEFMAAFCSPGDDHCNQAAAVQNDQPEDCSKVEYGPPRDKCHLMIAENTGDPTACDGMEGGMMGYSKEECLASVWKSHNASDCAGRDNELACRNAYAKNGKGCGDGFVRSKSTGECGKVPTKEECEGIQKVNPFCEGTDDDIEDKVANDLNTMKDAATGKYMDLLEKAIESEKDPGALAGLQAYKDFLSKSGETLENVTATVDTLKELKKIFLDAYDPSMDIEHMPVSGILKPGFFERVKTGLLGEPKQTPTEVENSAADDALSVYEAMLKRQGDIDELKKSKLDRLSGAVTEKLKEKAQGKLSETATTVAEGIAGTAMSAVGIVDHALSAFQEEAKKSMFQDLAKAYSRRRDDLAAKRPDLSPEQIHTLTVQQVKDDPYQDNTNTGFVKFGNLLENKDCNDDSGNPLCIDNRVWWTAMDKTYAYAAKSKK
jgi:hypothetical protein